MTCQSRRERTRSPLCGEAKWKNYRKTFAEHVISIPPCALLAYSKLSEILDRLLRGSSISFYNLTFIIQQCLVSIDDSLDFVLNLT